MNTPANANQPSSASERALGPRPDPRTDPMMAAAARSSLAARLTIERVGRLEQRVDEAGMVVASMQPSGLDDVCHGLWLTGEAIARLDAWLAEVWNDVRAIRAEVAALRDQRAAA